MGGYVLNPPAFMLRENDVRPKNGNVSIRSAIWTPIKIKDWLAVFSDRRDKDLDDWTEFYKTLTSAAKTFGIEF